MSAAGQWPAAPCSARRKVQEPRPRSGCAKASSCQISLTSPLARSYAGAINAAPALWSLRRDGLAIGGLPAPGAGAITPLGHALLVDLRDDFAVTRQQRLGRAHLGTERQFALGQPVGAILVVFLHRGVGLRAAGAIGAFVHLAARAEISDARILRCAEGACVEAIAAADAAILGM